MPAQNESIGDTLNHVWTNNKPLALIVLTALAVAAWFLIKNSQAQANATLATSAAATTPVDTSGATQAGAYPGSIANTYSTSTTSLNYSGPAQPPMATTPIPTQPQTNQPPVVQPTPILPTPVPTANPISGVMLPLPAPAKSTVQFGSTGNVGQRVYVTLPGGQQYKVYGDSDF